MVHIGRVSAAVAAGWLAGLDFGPLMGKPTAFRTGEVMGFGARRSDLHDS